MGRPRSPSRPEDRRREDRGGHEQRPHAGQQVAEVLADADAEQSMERREDDLDRGARRRRPSGPSGAAT